MSWLEPENHLWATKFLYKTLFCRSHAPILHKKNSMKTQGHVLVCPGNRIPGFRAVLLPFWSHTGTNLHEFAVHHPASSRPAGRALYKYEGRVFIHPHTPWARRPIGPKAGRIYQTKVSSNSFPRWLLVRKRGYVKGLRKNGTVSVNGCGNVNVNG